jgi:hypothetical protein
MKGNGFFFPFLQKLGNALVRPIPDGKNRSIDIHDIIQSEVFGLGGINGSR